jgi:hypothetical protein
VIARLQATGLQSMDLLLPAHRDLDRSEYELEGLCHPLSQALFCLFPGTFTAWYIEWEDDEDGHVFLRDAFGDIVDVISYPELLCDDEDYDAAEPVRWRPNLPAKRTRTLLARAGFALTAARSARVRRGLRPRRRAPVARRRNQ